MKKNGKEILCKFCGKAVYISASRFQRTKYCSFDCANKDNFGFKPKEKECVICQEKFTIHTGLKGNKKTCSNECSIALAKQITRKRIATIEKKVCKSCGSEFTALKYVIGTGKCYECRIKESKEKRLGSGNPNYKNGKYTFSNFQNRKSKTAFKHLNECKRYRKEFFEKNGYQFCEVCKVNTNGTSRFEVHHIYFASRFPNHENLHDNRNLIHICKECHLKFHNGSEYIEVFKKLEEERGLKQLFS